MKSKKYLKVILLITITTFLFAYFIETTGYYEYKLQNKKILTEEEMLHFEQDIKEGKEIDIEDYLKNTNPDYSNKLTQTTSELSLKLNDYLKEFLINGFNIFDGLFK